MQVGEIFKDYNKDSDISFLKTQIKKEKNEESCHNPPE